MKMKHYTVCFLILGSSLAMAADGPQIIIHEEPKYESPYDTTKPVKVTKPETPAIVFNPNRKGSDHTVQMAPIPPVISETSSVLATPKPVAKAVVAIKKEVQAPVKKEVVKKAEVVQEVKAKNVEPQVVQNKANVPVDLPVRTSDVSKTEVVPANMVLKEETKVVESVTPVQSSNGVLDVKIDTDKILSILAVVGKYLLFVLIAVLTFIVSFLGIKHVFKNYNFRRDPAYVNPWFKPSK